MQSKIEVDDLNHGFLLRDLNHDWILWFSSIDLDQASLEPYVEQWEQKPSNGDNLKIIQKHFP